MLNYCKRENFVLLTFARELYIYTSERIGNEKIIPKRRRYPTAQRLESMAFDILEKVEEANNTSLLDAPTKRRELQIEIESLCDTMACLIDSLKMSKAYPGIDARRAEYWIRKCLDVRMLCRAWRDSDRKRVE